MEKVPDGKLREQLINIMSGVDSIEGANSTPLESFLEYPSKTLKQSLNEILSIWNKHDVSKELLRYGITIDWSIIDNLLK